MTGLIKAVFFDVDNTLLDFDKGAEAACREAARELDITLPEQTMETFHLISNPLWQALQDGLLTLEELYRVRWTRIFALLELPYDGVIFERVFRSRLRESAVPVEGAPELLDYLQGRYTLVAASNGPHAQQLQRLERAGMLSCFRRCFTSELLGFSKPRREFFDACFAELEGIEPGETVMIGDSPSSDIAGAVGYGMRACWFNKRNLPGPAPGAEWVVASLAEVRAFL